MKIRWTAVLAVIGVPVFAETLFHSDFRSGSALPPDWKNSACSQLVKLEDGECALRISGKDATGKSIDLKRIPVNLKRSAGRRLTVKASVRRDLTIPSVKWQGGKLQFSIRTPRGREWPGVYMAKPKCDWENLTLTADIPADATEVSLDLGIQNASGTIEYRDLSVESGDAVLRLDSFANMGFRDPVARDGKGGWSDQGPYNDAANFPYRKRTFAGVPFSIPDPDRNNGKAVVVFRSAHFPNGSDGFQYDLTNAAIKGKYLYLLHTLTFGYNFKGVAGSVELTGKNGRKTRLEIRGGRDVSDWWMPKRLANACPASRWQNRSGGEVGVYLSKFRIPDDLGEIASVRFSAGAEQVLWILLGATISEHDYPFPETSVHTIRADAVWRPLPAPETPGILPGSALDLSGILNQPEVGKFGRVIINAKGNFAFAEKPEQAVRFLSAVYLRGLFHGHGNFKSPLRDRKTTEAFVRQLKMQGYNMIRFHYLDATLLEGSQEDCRLNPKTLDKFDYLIACMKRNGIYANIDFMASRIGYAHGNSWTAKPGDKRQFKLDIFFQPSVRENWKQGVRALLTHVNPYTKTRLIDDPVLAVAVSYNEQEFAWGFDNFHQARGEWQTFLKQRYGTIDALRRAWGRNAAEFSDFSAIPAFTKAQTMENSPRGTDVARFILQKEQELVRWYQNTARGLGFKGYLGTYTMGQSLRNIVSRRENDFIALNNYFAHPFSNAIDVSSGISRYGKLIRAVLSVRQSGKPLLVTELGHAFWNPYRYEEGLVAGAYAAFQGIDGLSPFAEQVTIFPEVFPINTFQLRHDAILKSQEFLIAFLFRRGDVRTADTAVRVQIDPEAIFPTNTHSEALNSDQTNLAFVTGFSTDCTGTRKKAQKNEYLLPAAGGSSVMIQSIGVAGYTQAGEARRGLFHVDKVLAELKRAGIVPKTNRTDAEKGIFETATGEIFMNVKTHFLSVNTPRFQGICGEKHARAKLRDFEIRDLGVRANLSLVSLENDRSLADAERMVLVFATNLLNSGMVFEDASCRTRLSNGTAPLLLETGTFHAVLNNRNAEKLKLYALGLNGKRIAELPLKRKDGAVEILVDTAKIPNGPSLYFELATQ